MRREGRAQERAVEQAVLLGHAREIGKGKGGARELGRQRPKAGSKHGKKKKRRWASSVIGLERESGKKRKETLFSFSGFYKLAPNSN